MKRWKYGLTALLLTGLLGLSGCSSYPEQAADGTPWDPDWTMLGAVLSSQIISNVPAAVLLSNFTTDAKGMLLGTNIGGLGTLVASLASLISFKQYIRTPGAKPLRYLGLFTAVNVVMLVVLYIFAAICL